MITITVDERPAESVEQVVEYNGRRVHLARREAEVFAHLVAHRGSYRTAAEVFSAVWGDVGSRLSSPDAIASGVIFKLRRKLPGAVESVRGLGYRVPT